ncbi:hypothetical protein PR048_032921 [Dryococelus australis]|uniref:Hexosyltransferase n=1 Tax=Dryococelus australis TaxID=614101 RepID=A0ABQ9G7Q1_9NEOP|nr:hypothetical protein PR048_032921 [Dryococelus australis]
MPMVLVRLSQSLLPKLALVFCVLALIYVTTTWQRPGRFTAEDPKMSALESRDDVLSPEKSTARELIPPKTLLQVPKSFDTTLLFTTEMCAVRDLQPQERLEDLNLRPLSVKYNGTPITEMYPLEFDVDSAACPDDGSGVDVVIVIHSTAKDEDQRMAIRHTRESLHLRRDVVVVFLLGTSMDEALTRNVRKESQTYGDVIWVSRRCPKARFFLTTDDDVFHDVPRFLEFLRRPEVSTVERTIFGGLTRKSRPNKTPGHKYYISEDYPGRTYVDYVQGSCYLVTDEISRDPYQAYLQSKFFTMEDVFFTGLMEEMVGARRVGPDNFCEVRYLIKVSPEKPDDVDPCALRGKIALHYVDCEHMFRM